MQDEQPSKKRKHVSASGMSIRSFLPKPKQDSSLGGGVGGSLGRGAGKVSLDYRGSLPLFLKRMQFSKGCLCTGVGMSLESLLHRFRWLRTRILRPCGQVLLAWSEDVE